MIIKHAQFSEISSLVKNIILLAKLQFLEVCCFNRLTSVNLNYTQDHTWSSLHLQMSQLLIVLGHHQALFIVDYKVWHDFETFV